MMLRYFKYWLILLFAFFLLHPSKLSAIARLPDMPDSDSAAIFYSGQNHSYSVTFRGNGEAVVNGRILFGNQSETPLDNLSLRIPKIDLKNPQIYQVVFDPYCIRYESGINPGCIEYQEPDHNNWWGQKSYFKADFKIDGDSLLISLPKPVKPQGWGSVIVYFRGFGYARKSVIGNYRFDFETFKTSEQIDELTVGVMTDSDLFLKGVKGKVDYRFSAPEFSAMGQSIQSTDGKIASVDSYYQQIGQGQIVKQAYKLAPLESYKVKGIYSDSRIKLYFKDSAVAATVMIAILMVVFIIFSKIRSAKSSSQPLALTIAGGLASAIIILVATIIFVALTRLFSYYTYGQYETIFLVFFLMVVCAIFFIIITALPALFMGKKFGIWWGLGVVFSTFCWLVIFLLIAIFAFLIRGRAYSEPVPLGGVRTMEIKKNPVENAQ